MRLLTREVLAADEKYVGLLLPPSVGGGLANAALPLARRIPVNLNYTMSAESINSCIRQCGIRHVLTTRRVIDKLNIKLDAELVLLEDFRDKVKPLDKLVAALQVYATPIGLLERWLGLKQIQPDDLLTVIFTSGSTGEPKGVMLSHRNILSNVDAIDQLVKLNDDDVVAGALPFFHSFGFTTTLWTVLTLPPKGVYHFDPLRRPADRRDVPQAPGDDDDVDAHLPAVLLETLPAGRVRQHGRRRGGRGKAAQRTVRRLRGKFGLRPVEGYGATECFAAGGGQYSRQPRRLPARRSCVRKGPSAGRFPA